MNIIAERVTGHVFVVAPDETRALEAFEAGSTFDTERMAVDHENYENLYGYTDEQQNTYKITVTAERVH